MPRKHNYCISSTLYHLHYYFSLYLGCEYENTSLSRVDNVTDGVDASAVVVAMEETMFHKLVTLNRPFHLAMGDEDIAAGVDIFVGARLA